MRVSAALSLALALTPLSALADPRRVSFDDIISMHRSGRANRDRGTTLCSVKGFKGSKTDAGACRYVIEYARAGRWEYSTININAASQDMTKLPPACPQDANDYVAGQEQSENCLYATVYTPPNGGSGLPVYVWIHGGSFVYGSSSAPGLDGSRLAVEGNMIVVLLQYRLGVLGFLPPSMASSAPDPNLGLLDVMNGLKAIHSYIDLVGGDRSKVTVGGQSSGAGMIRALFGAPAAQGLFRAAILQSDPFSYGLAPPNITDQLRTAFYSSEALKGCGDLACLKRAPLKDILSAQAELLETAPYTIPGVPMAEVFRPTYLTTTLPYEPTSLFFTNPSSLTYSPATIPLLITTTRNEAGTVISDLFPAPIPASNATFNQALTAFLGPDRAQKLIKSGAYVPRTDSVDSMRETLERLVTDGIWRCPTLEVATSWTGMGGVVWVGEWLGGQKYARDGLGGYCDVDGRVCHEDDIYPSFGNTLSIASDSQSSDDEVLSRWISFITHLDPNPPAGTAECPSNRTTGKSDKALKEWKKYTSSADVCSIGGEGKVSSCPDGLWGKTVKYDWQLYSP